MSTVPGGEPAPATEQPDPNAMIGLTPPAVGPAPEVPVVQEPQPVTPAPVEGEPSPWSEEFRAQYPTLADKFKGAGDLAKSYAQLETWFHAFREAGLTPETAMARLVRAGMVGTAEGEGEDAEGAAPGDGEVIPSEETAELAHYGIPADDEAFMDALAAGPRTTIEKVAQRITVRTVNAILTARDQYEQAVKKYPDLPTFEPQMRRILRVAPEIVKLDNSIERMYHMVKGGASTAEVVTRAQAATREQTLAQVRGSIVESGRGGAAPVTPGQPGASIVDEIIFAGGGGPNQAGLRRV